MTIKRGLLTAMLAIAVLLMAGACGGKKADKANSASEAAKKVTASSTDKTKAAEPKAEVVKKAEPKAEDVKKAEPKAEVVKKAEPKAADAKKADHHADAKQPAPKRIKGPVAKINGTAIDSKVFYEELDKITARNNRIPPERLSRIEQNILKRLIEKELIAQAVKKAKVTVPEAEVDKAFAEYKVRFQTDEQFENYLKHGRVTVESIKERLRDKKSLEKLIDARGNLKIGDAEAKQFYEKNERFYVEKAGTKASHILVKVEEKASKEQEAAALAKIKEIQKLIKAGKDFAEIAKKKSEGPSAPKGGDLGYFGKGQMVKAFEEAAFKMKKDEISGPVRTRFGFHIIKVTDRREERKKPFAEVKDQIVQSLRNKKFFQERRDLLATLRKEAKIEKFIAEPAPSKKKELKAPPAKINLPKSGSKASLRPPTLKPKAPVKPKKATPAVTK